MIFTTLISFIIIAIAFVINIEITGVKKVMVELFGAQFIDSQHIFMNSKP